MGLFDFFRRKREVATPYVAPQVTGADRQAQLQRWQQQRMERRALARTESYGRIARWVQIRLSRPTEQEARIQLAYAGVREYPSKVILRQPQVRDILGLAAADNEFSGIAPSAASQQPSIQKPGEQERRERRERNRREGYGRIARWIQVRMSEPTEQEARLQLAYAGLGEQPSKTILSQPEVRGILGLSPEDNAFSGAVVPAVTAPAATAATSQSASAAGPAVATTPEASHAPAPAAPSITLSEDGQWAWNGTEWVPAHSIAQPPAAPTTPAAPVAPALGGQAMATGSSETLQRSVASEPQPASSLGSILDGLTGGSPTGAATPDVCGHPHCSTGVSNFDFRCFSCRNRFCAAHKGSSIDCVLCQAR